MDRQVADQFVDKRLTTAAPLLCSRALDTVDQFHDSHYGQANFFFSIGVSELLQDLPHGVAPPLTGNDNAGIED